MHGLLGTKGDLTLVKKWCEEYFPGIFVLNVEIGNGRQDSLVMNINKQIENFAQQVKSHPELKDGFNLIGHSQGGLITRAYVERFNNPPVYNLISWAGPNSGQYGVPDFNYWCPEKDTVCDLLDWGMSYIAENGADVWVQQHISFAAYWKDPYNYDSYLENNIFLSDINNEKPSKNQTYTKNIEKLNKYLMIYSTTDKIVMPKTSPWFEFWKPNQDVDVKNFKDTNQYKQNFIGLRTLADSNRLIMKHIPCGHREIPNPSCKPYFIEYTLPLLNNTIN